MPRDIPPELLELARVYDLYLPADGSLVVSPDGGTFRRYDAYCVAYYPEPGFRRLIHLSPDWDTGQDAMFSVDFGTGQISDYWELRTLTPVGQEIGNVLLRRSTARLRAEEAELLREYLAEALVAQTQIGAN